MEEGSERKRRQAVALRYVPEERDAPHVVAAGLGILAERIIAAARGHGIPVYEDPKLVAALAQVDIGREIPPELYIAIAEVLAFVFSAEMRAAVVKASPRHS